MSDVKPNERDVAVATEIRHEVLVYDARAADVSPTLAAYRAEITAEVLKPVEALAGHLDQLRRSTPSHAAENAYHIAVQELRGAIRRAKGEQP